MTRLVSTALLPPVYWRAPFTDAELDVESASARTRPPRRLTPLTLALEKLVLLESDWLVRAAVVTAPTEPTTGRFADVMAADVDRGAAVVHPIELRAVGPDLTTPPMLTWVP